MTMRFSSWVFVLGMLVAVVTACGPSEAEVTKMVNDAVAQSEAEASRMLDDVVEQSEARLKAQHYSKAEASQMVNDAVEQSETRLKAEFDDKLEQQNEEHLALIAEQVFIMEDMADLVQRVRDTHQANRDIFAEADQMLERAVCETDYWVNATRTMLWYSLDYASGGPTTLEEAQGFWGGIVVPDDYGRTLSVICDVGGEGQWVLKSNVLRVTENVQAR